MPCVLVQNNTTIIPPIYDGALPNWLTLPDGRQVTGLPRGTIQAGGIVITTDGYSILPAQYDAPQVNSQETGRSYSISNGVVQVTRTWQFIYAPQAVLVQINSASTPALNGPYSITSQSLANYRSLLAQAQVLNAFPGGTSTVLISDVNGTPHNFTVATLASLLSAINAYPGATILNII